MKKLFYLFLLTLFSVTIQAARKQDVLNAVNIGAQGSNYTEYTFTGPSGAKYSILCAASYNSVQLRTNSQNSGIVVTNSPGKIVSISIDWNSNTSDDRILNVYSSSSAYTAPSQLFANGLNPVTTFNKSNGNKSYTFPTQPSYIGLRSANNALYINSITIEWETNGSTGQPEYSSVAETISRIKGGYSGPATVKGIISKIDSYNPTYHSITYWISDDGTTSNQMQVYSGLGLNGKNFNSINDIETGANVVVSGTVKNYNGIPEFDYNSTQLEYTAPTRVTNITLNKTSLSLQVGSSETLIATVYPSNAIDKTITWTSTNAAVASVDNNGNVKALKEGSATIKATCGSVSATCVVTVTPINATSIALDKTMLDLKEGETYQLKATVYPSNATNKTITWTSTNAAVASVDNNGNVKALKEGSATIKATCGSVSATCAVTVAINPVPAVKVELDKTSLDLKIGDSYQLKATVYPANTTNKIITWTSTNVDAIPVDNNGNVKALKEGSATIRATCGSVSATCTVKVSPIDVTSIVLNKNSLELTEGESYELKATVSPSNATDKTVTWTSSNSAVATVDNNGNVKAVKEGSANIIAKSGAVSATCAVKVKPVIIDVTSIQLDKSSMELKVGESYQLKATVSPANATDKTVTWTSSNSAVATVDNNGNVRAVKEGSANITAKSGAVSALCTVKVNSKSASIDGINYLYKDNSSDAIVGAGSYGSLSYITIPSSVTINGSKFNVTGIEAGAFKNCNNLKEVILPTSIKTVGADAFTGCDGLIKAAYPNSLSNPFKNGTAISYPASGSIIENNIIYNTQKTQLFFVSVRTKGEFAVPSSVTVIGPSALLRCTDLSSVVIGNSVKEMGASAFEGCYGLTAVKMNDLAQWCKIKFNNVTANPLYHAHNVVLDGMEIADLSLPGTISTIEDFAFINCHWFQSITLPSSITKIGKSAFDGCTRLTSITSYPVEPPVIESNTFWSYSVPLYIPEESASKYRNANYWKNFSNIEYTNIVYLGLIGFNRDLTRKSIAVLDPTSVNDYTDWVNDLTLNSNTLLYYTVDQGINTLVSTSYRTKLANAILITFTDGLDQGSLAFNNSFKTDQDYAYYLSNKIAQTKVQDISLKAYAIGVKGEDVSDENLFITNLNSISSSPENVHQISNVNQVDKEFDSIYNDLTLRKNQLILTISVPFMSDGVLCRFTFDNASSAEGSKIWAQGTFNRSKLCLENMTYEGFSSVSGSTVVAVQNGLNLSFTFEDCRDQFGNILSLQDKSYIGHWTYVTSNGKWQHNVEMGDNDIELEKRNSTVVMMLIDCSSSLGENDFAKIKTTANTFIERLINYKGNYFDEIDEVIFDEGINRPNDIYTLQGICIKHDATQEDIDNLPKGLYIIGGRKVLVR